MSRRDDDYVSIFDDVDDYDDTDSILDDIEDQEMDNVTISVTADDPEKKSTYIYHAYGEYVDFSCGSISELLDELSSGHNKRFHYDWEADSKDIFDIEEKLKNLSAKDFQKQRNVFECPDVHFIDVRIMKRGKNRELDAWYAYDSESLEEDNPAYDDEEDDFSDGFYFDDEFSDDNN